MKWHRRHHGKDKPVTPFRVVTHGSLRHVVEQYRPREWGGDWEPVARCTSRQLAQQIYTRLMMRYIEEALR